MKSIEPIIENVPVLAYWGCAVYIITARRK
jgi:hypothetical protein